MIDIGKVGIWNFFETQTAAKAQEATAELEELGFKVVWMPEAVGREVMTAAGLLLAATRKIVIATGIANIWARDAVTMSAAQKTLCEAYPNRFLLGIGVSHAPLVEGVRGHRYDKPLSAMRSYLDAMDKALYVAPPPGGETPRVIGALAPKMLKLSAERADGAHPYFVPPEHTTHARSILGKGPLLAPEQAVVLETDPSKARMIARAHMMMYLSLPNYVNNLKRLGFSDADIENGGSDRLVDAIVVWGNIDAVAKRVRAHHDAGADHVCVQVLGSDPTQLPHSQWHELASALLG
jgi:probable F420-dependent oxidoreductase